MFPTAESVVYYNEAGEIMGWDNPSYYEAEFDPADFDYEDYEDDEDDGEDDE